MLLRQSETAEKPQADPLESKDATSLCPSLCGESTEDPCSSDLVKTLERSSDWVLTGASVKGSQVYREEGHVKAEAEAQ